jgi:methionyl-tRNA formyltransferase
MFLKKKKDLNLKFLNKKKPDIIFFPHWNYLVKREIFQNYLCIGFHTSPLPYGRGGSPVQNMIVRNFKKTQLCSLKLTKKIDSGPIYMKKEISLKGTGEKIFLNIYRSILDMIFQIEKKIPIAKNQTGKAVYFKRRKPTDGNLLISKNTNEIFNLIRMLDINFLNYPKAFIENKKIIFKFKNARLKKNKVVAEVDILRK